MAEERSVSSWNQSFAGWVVGALRCGVIAVDADARLRILNAEARRILGLSAGEAADWHGRCADEVLGAQPRVALLLRDALTGRAEHVRAELEIADRGPGPDRVVGFTLSPVRDGADRIRGAALFFRDLSALERMDERGRMADRLAALGEMAARMAHEIRNPLAGMKVMAQLLERKLGDRPEEGFMLRELQDELRAVERVVRTGLDFVRSAPPDFDCVDLPELIERCIARAQAHCAFVGKVERSLADALPRPLADPDQLGAVITNLLINAMEAAEEGDAPADALVRIGVGVREADPARRPYRLAAGREGGLDATRVAPLPGEGAGRELVISVEDLGPGVPPELTTRIFYPFFSTKDEGSGVGLSTAQKIVAEHGGRIDLEPGPLGGALFHVRLPLVEAEAFSVDRAGGEG